MNIPLIVPHSTPTPAQPPPPPPPPGGLPRFTADSIPSMAPFPQGGSAVEDSNAVQPKLQMSAWSEEVSGAGGGTFIHWPFQDPKLEVPTVYKAYVRLYPTKYGLIWHSTSNSGSWNSHWFIQHFKYDPYKTHKISLRLRIVTIE